MAALVAGALASGAGCNGSGAMVAAGGTLAVLGGIVLLDREETPPCTDRVFGCPEHLGNEINNGTLTVIGGGLLLLATGLMIAGGVGLAAEARADKAEAVNATLTMEVASPASAGHRVIELPSASPTSPTSAPPTSVMPATALASRGEISGKLALHVRLAARADRCEAAKLMLTRLMKVDAALGQALLGGDAHVARCSSM